MPKKETENSMPKFVRSSLIGTLATFFVCVILILLGSLCVTQGLISEQHIMKYILFTCFLGCFIGGTMGASKAKSKTLVIGICVAIVVFLIQMFIGHISYTEASVEEKGIPLLLADLAGGILAGFIGGRRKKRKKR